MYKAKEGSLTKKEIGIFTILVIILGFSKVTLGGFALPVFLIITTMIIEIKKYL